MAVEIVMLTRTGLSGLAWLKVPARPQLGWWAVLALTLVAGTVLHGDVARLENPDGEKKVPLFPPGQNDFSYTYMGARALLAGVNPYHNDRSEFTHPIFPPRDFGGYKQIYPPGNLLVHLPLALWKGADYESAGRIWFGLSLVELVLLAVLTWALTRRIMGVPLTPVWIVFVCVCLTLNTGVELALERGQSDIVVAFLAWGAIACFLRGRYAASTFLSIWSVSIKGYAILLAIGLGLLVLDRRRWKPLLIGGALAVAILVVPVLHLMGDAMRAVAFRKDMFWPVWYNHSFSNAAYTLAPGWKEKGRIVLSVFALGVTIASFIQARRALARGAPERAALWVVAFASASLGTMIGYSALSISYNLILVLPGALILVACQQRFRSVLALPRWAEHLLGFALLGSSLLLFSYRIGGKGPPTSGSGVPASSFGLVALFAILAVVLSRALNRADDIGPPV